MEDIDKELRPVLAKLVTLEPGNNHHSEVIQLYDWLIHPERTAEEFQHVVGPLHDYVYQSLEDYFNESVFKKDDRVLIELQNIVGLSVGEIHSLMPVFFWGHSDRHIYMLRTAAESLAARCPVLEGRWEQIAWLIFVPLGEKKFQDYGNVSSHLSNWIIQVVGNPEVCPNVDLRYQILLLYKTLVKIDNTNYKQALESFMSMCCFIDKVRVNESTLAKTKNILECLMIFKKEESRDKSFECHWVNEDPCEEFLYKFGLTVAETLRSHRCRRQHIHLHDTSHDYSMGLKTIAEPRELLCLTKFIRYLSNLARLEYLAFKDRREYNIEQLLVSSCGLVNIVRGFLTALHDPMLISITAESIIDVLEAGLIILHHEKDEVIWPRSSHALTNINLLFEELFNLRDDGGMDVMPIGWEIITKFKSRIFYIKSQINEEFLEDDNGASTLYAILYHTKY